MSAKKQEWGKSFKEDKKNTPKKDPPSSPHKEKPKEISPVVKESTNPPAPWKCYKDVVFYVNKNRNNIGFLQETAKHFGVTYSADFESLSKAIFSVAQHHAF